MLTIILCRVYCVDCESHTMQSRQYEKHITNECQEYFFECQNIEKDSWNESGGVC